MQALILCGGKGERLKPLTHNTPKPMIRIRDKSIIEYIIDHILFYSLDDLILLTGYKSEIIENHIKSKYPNDNIIFSDSGNVDIIERILDASKYINDDFILLYGDTISDVNIYNLINHHKNNKADITMTAWPVKSQFGVIEIDDESIISSFKEKPVLDQWINIGYFYFRKNVLLEMEKYEKFENFLSAMIIKRKITGFKHTGAHITVNTVKELEEAEKNISQIENKILGSI